MHLLNKGYRNTRTVLLEAKVEFCLKPNILLLDVFQYVAVHMLPRFRYAQIYTSLTSWPHYFIKVQEKQHLITFFSLSLMLQTEVRGLLYSSFHQIASKQCNWQMNLIY